jgi:hypothetical protein
VNDASKEGRLKNGYPINNENLFIRWQSTPIERKDGYRTFSDDMCVNGFDEGVRLFNYPETLSGTVYLEGA